MASESIDAPTTGAPSWARAVRAEFPAGVRIEGRTLFDEVAGFSVELEPATAELLAPLARPADVAAILERNPAAWPLLEELNREHMLNFARSGSVRALPARRACRRFPLDGRSPLGAAAALARALFHLFRACWPFSALLAGAAALGVILPGLAAFDAAMVVVHGLASYLVHELGHTVAAAALRVPAYALVDRFGLSVWARLDANPRGARLFAAAGPAAAIGAGVIVLAALAPLGALRATIHAAPYLAHVIGLVPPSHDGRILWRRARRATPVGART